jgi:hypothetical protein
VARRGRAPIATGFFTGAGLSYPPPASLPLARPFHYLVDRACYTAAARVAPGLLGEDAFEAVLAGPWNLLARLESTSPGAGAGALACMRVDLPNEGHLLAAFHLARGGLHVTVNVDDGIERAYALLSGAEEPPEEGGACRDVLDSWRRCFPRDAPALRVLSAPEPFDAAALAARPVLVKLHGTLGRSRDGVVLPLGSVLADADVTDLGLARTAAIEALAAEAFVVVTGYSGSDLASYAAIVERLEAGRFSWAAPGVRREVRLRLRAIDPRQPVATKPEDVLRRHLAVALPWPSSRTRGRGFEERFAAWSAALAPEVAAEAFAWALSDAGRHPEAVLLLERLATATGERRTTLRLADAIAARGEAGDAAAAARIFRRATWGAQPEVRAYSLVRWAECRADAGGGAIAGAALASTARGRRQPGGRVLGATALLGIVLSRLERNVTRAATSRSRRLALRAVTAAASRYAAGALARSAHAPTGRRRALLQRQWVELETIAALLVGRPAPIETLRSLRLLSETFAHLEDRAGRADTLTTQALVLLSRSEAARARHALREAGRLQPPSSGLCRAVGELLERAGSPASAEPRWR